MSSHHHRGGSLKQSNKTHSGYKGHASKRSLKKQRGGRVAGKHAGGTEATTYSRADRRNQSVQIRKGKRLQHLALRRAAKFGGPHVVGVIQLAAGASPKAVIESLMTKCDGAKLVSALGIRTGTSVAGRPVTGDFTEFKKRFTFIEAAANLTAILDVAKVADTLIVVVPVDRDIGGCVDDLGVSTISVLINQGIGNLIGVLQGLERLPPKKQAEMKKYVGW